MSERNLYTCDVCGLAKYSDEANQWRIVNATIIEPEKDDWEYDDYHICPDCWKKFDKKIKLAVLSIKGNR